MTRKRTLRRRIGDLEWNLECREQSLAHFQTWRSAANIHVAVLRLSMMEAEKRLEPDSEAAALLRAGLAWKPDAATQN